MILFWTIFVGLVILWYLLVTLLVGFKGAGDIRQIFRKLKQDQQHGEQI